MMFDDDMDDIFNWMDGVFGKKGRSNPEYIDYKASERIITDDNIFYTITVRDVNKNELEVLPYKDHIIVAVNKGTGTREFRLELPYQIDSNDIKVTYVNGILDITTIMTEDAKKSRVKIE